MSPEKENQSRGGSSEAGAGKEKSGFIFRDKKTDEGWKEKAQKEKETLSDRVEEVPELPPASFLGLIDELSLRVMLALGQIRNPKATEVYIDLDGAKYMIDTLEMLEQKTRGNLTPEEAATLREVLHNLRLLYVHIARTAEAAPEHSSPEGKGSGSEGLEGGQKDPEKPGGRL